VTNVVNAGQPAPMLAPQPAGQPKDGGWSLKGANLLGRTVAWAALQAARFAPTDTNTWLEGRFAPIPAEITETSLRVTGQVPADLNGLYLRNGPNPLRNPNPGAYHWFMGEGMVHGVRLGDGRAQWYRNRYVGTDYTQRRLGRGRVPGPRRGAFETVNTNIIGHGGRLWALVEAGPYPVELDKELNSLRHGLFDSAISSSFAAHPHRDPATGELHAICYDVLKPSRVRHVVVSPDCRVTRMESIPVRHGPLMHDSALTKSSVVILDLPVTFSLGSALRGNAFPYCWNDRHPARVGLLPKTGTADQVRWFEVEPCFVFHTVNAVDLPDGGALLDVIVHSRMFHRTKEHGPEGDVLVTLERWTLDARTGKVRRAVLNDRGQEFPRIDERRTGTRYRYAYTAAFSRKDEPLPLLRHDFEQGRTLAHDFGPYRVPGEFVFVPRPNSTAEDDGWLVGFTHAFREGNSDLVILNAQDFTGEPQAVVHLPQRVPMGFHGNWVPFA
jgi:8'-apo-carotenoid 13,14-cleaving dioxygenase